MASTLDYSEEQRSVLKKAQALLRLASSSTHPEERASAEKKVQDLLLAYNLSAAAVGDGDEGRRAQEKLKGGFYKYERTLWSYVADVNFCLHWTDQDYVERDPKDAARKKVRERYSGYAQMYRKVTRQHVVGRAINVEATKFTVAYLKEAIERELREFLFGRREGGSVESRVVGAGELLRSKRANDFREAAADSIASRLWERRLDQQAEERKKQLAEEALRAAGGVGDGTGTQLTISSVRQSERDANMDVLYGDGWSARQRAEKAAQAAALKAAEDEYTRWAADHPEEAAAEERKRRKEQKRKDARAARGGGGGRSRKSDISDWGAYRAGRDAGGRIGLDPQTTHASAPKMIGRS